MDLSNVMHVMEVSEAAVRKAAQPLCSGFITSVRLW